MKYKAMNDWSSMDAVNIYCFDDNDDNYYVLEDGEYVAKEKVKGRVTMTTAVQPLLTIKDPDNFLQALLDLGLKTPDQGFCEGKLEATEGHLADMKKILFKNLGVK